MRRFGNATWVIAAAIVLFPPRIQAQTNTNVVTVAFSSAATTPLNPDFAGFACEMLDSGLEYDNTNFQKIAASLSPGWIRYPAAFPTTPSIGPQGLRTPTGLKSSVATITRLRSNSCSFTILPLLGKGWRAIHQFRQHDRQCRRQNHRVPQLLHRRHQFRRAICRLRLEQSHSRRRMGALQ